MNALGLPAGALAGFVTFSGFLLGIPWFLRPVREGEVALGPRMQMVSMFHYVSLYLAFSAGFLLRAAWPVPARAELVHFIAVMYAGFAIAQLFVVFGTPAAVRQLFQMFAKTAACAWLSVA